MHHCMPHLKLFQTIQLNQKSKRIFDVDKNGVIEGSELSKLKVWVDDNADAKTDKGELQSLSKHGITQIVIPGHHELESTSKSLQETKKQQKCTFQNNGPAINTQTKPLHLVVHH